MGGTAITIEGKQLTYFVAGESLSSSDRNDVEGFDLLDDRELTSHPRLRRVLTRMVRPTPLFYGVLHWSDGTDLEELDRKVLSHTIDDEDFDAALLAQPRTVICRNCEAHLRVLAVDTGQALFARTLPERLRSHQFSSSCPVCRTALGMPIVEFLGEDAEQ